MTKFMKYYVATAVVSMVGFASSIWAQTGASTNIPNTAVVTGANFATANSLYTVVVATQIGASAAGSLGDTTGAANTTTVNAISVTNKGNVTANFLLSFSAGQSSNVSLAWPNVGFGPAQTSTTNVVGLAPGASATVNFRVTIPALENNTAVRSYTIIASNAQVWGVNTVLTQYTGDNTLVYGGEFGKFNAGPRRAYAGPFVNSSFSNTTAGVASTASRTWSLKVSAAVVSILKTAKVTNSWRPSLTAPVPGATVIYKIAISNSGSTSATNLEILDTVPANTTYVGSSLKIGNTGDVYAGAATSPSDANGDDKGARVGANIEFVGPTGAGNADTTTGGPAAGLTQQTGRGYFFRVTIN